MKVIENVSAENVLKIIRNFATIKKHSILLSFLHLAKMFGDNSLISSCCFLVSLLVWLNFQTTPTSATGKGRSKEYGYMHRDWDHYVRWRFQHLGKKSHAPTEEDRAKYHVWNRNMQEVGRVIFFICAHITSNEG